MASLVGRNRSGGVGLVGLTVRGYQWRAGDSSHSSTTPDPSTRQQKDDDA